MWFQLISLLLAQGIMTQAVTLVAKVSVGGVKGTATFDQPNLGEQVTLDMKLSGPNQGQASTWRLHAFRLNYDVMARCDVTHLGPRIVESVGSEVINGSQTVSNLELSGMNSIEGRSIVYFNSTGSAIACATVESSEDYVTARASFRKTILGHVIFRQQKASSSALTRVTVDLYSDGSESSARDLEWRIVEGGGCSTVGAVYNPGGVTGTCVSGNYTSCAVGDLNGKLGPVSVGTTKGSKRWTSVDLNLPLSGSGSVLGKSLQLFPIGQSTPLIACAPISAYVSRTGVATFDNDGVTGTITLTQPSPLDPTTTSVDLKNLRSMASGYHVHNYPVPQRLAKDQSLLCNDASVSGHFNPFGVVYGDNSPAAAASTEDMYEVGDLSKKYGLLNGADNKSENYTDFNLPLFGTNSVLGRSLVIHYDRSGGPRWVCTNIHDTMALTSVLATFTFPVIGHVLLTQRVGEEKEGETTVYYRLDYGDGASVPSSGHSWAVHQNKVNGDMLEDDVSKRCVSAGDVINPFDVSATGYDTQCRPLDPLRCRAGDLKGKHGAVAIRAKASTPAIGFFTDVNLPLQGLNSVVNKSLVLKAADGGANSLACANLLKVWPQVLEAKKWGDGADFGSVTFSQQVGVVQAPTTIRLELKAVSSRVDYSVSKQPVDTQDKANRCGKLGGVYNPFEVSSPGSTKDAVPVGDLSAKFDDLRGAGGPVSGLTLLDPSLDVWGPRGVGGRAFTLTSPSGTSIGCADVLPKMVSGAGGDGKLFTAKAVFAGGEVIGHIMLVQYVYPGGAMTPTTVIVNLQKANGTQTQGHNWHTHVSVVGNDSTASTGRCASTGGHYNPFKVNVKEQYSECKLTNPLRCELGDQSNKLGTYDMGSGPMVVNDPYLPLTGPHGVVGRSIVVHMADKGAPRLACADVMPADHAHSHNIGIKASPSLNRTAMVQKIAQALSMESYNVAVEFTTNDGTGCVATRVYFLGMDADMYLQKLTDMLDSDASSLGMYQPAKQCSTSSADTVLTSLCLLVASLVLGRLLV